MSKSYKGDKDGKRNNKNKLHNWEDEEYVTFIPIKKKHKK